MAQSDSERGKVSGTPVGCACGDGVIDWAKVIEICRTAPRDIVFSVECGTVDQAGQQHSHLSEAAIIAVPLILRESGRRRVRFSNRYKMAR